METTITWAGDVRFQAETDSGHSVVIDGPPALGGQNTGLRPMEMVLGRDGRLHGARCSDDPQEIASTCQ